jgi:hypothetical protein
MNRVESDSEAVLFTRDVIRFTRLVAKNTVLKSGVYHFPIIIKSLSLTQAVVITQFNNLLSEILVKNQNKVSLRFYIEDREYNNTFFVDGQIIQNNPYLPNSPFYLLHITLSPTLPSQFVALIKPLVEAQQALKNREDKRIYLRNGYLDMLYVNSDKCYMVFNNAKSRVYLRDISYKGASFIVYNDGSLKGNEVLTLVIVCSGENDNLVLEGKCLRSQKIDEGHNLYNIAFVFNENSIPFGYKVFINKAFQINQQEMV